MAAITALASFAKALSAIARPFPRDVYIPLGSLRRIFLYPQEVLAASDADLLAVPRIIGLSALRGSIDESTAAPDEASEVALHRLVRGRLQSSTVPAVSHREALAKVYDALSGPDT